MRQRGGYVYRLRPERVARLINLEGFGLADRKPEDVPEHYAGWLDQLRTPSRMHDCTDLRDLVLRLQGNNNPRLTDERRRVSGAELGGAQCAGAL